MVDQASEGVREAWWWKAEEERSPRMRYLRDAVWNKGAYGGSYEEGIQMGIEKTYWWTKVFKETDGQLWLKRRAKALAALLENIPIFIIDNSQIVGYSAERPNRLNMQPEGSSLLNDDNYYDPTGFISSEDKPWVRKALNYWRDKDFYAVAEEYLSYEEATVCKMGLSIMSHMHLDMFTSCNPDYDYFLQFGLNGIIKRIEENMAQAYNATQHGTASPEKVDLIPKIDQWNAMLITAKAVIHWGNRYSRLAKIIAENFETDTTRKAELQKISDICAKVPGDPPEHFQEVIQAQHFVDLVHKHMERSMTGWGFRQDVLWWPYYEKDVKIDKTLSRREAQELVEEHRIRIWENCKNQSRIMREVQQGAGDLPVVTIGGVDAQGRDSCNELTEVVCDAARSIRVCQPSIVFRYRPTTSMSALRSAFECVRQGIGVPSFESESHAIGHLTGHYGFSIEEARSWANSVCMSPVPTKGPRTMGARYSSAIPVPSNALTLAFHDGWDPVSKLQGPVRTGDATKFETFEELWEAYKRQLRYAVEYSCRTRNTLRFIETRHVQQPLCSCLFDRCVETGVDVTDPRSGEGSVPWNTVITCLDAGDAMYATKKLVFDEKKYTMSQLVEALKANWEGYEEMWQDFLNAPKWGNDIDEVDEICVRVQTLLSEEHMRNVEWGGGRWLPLPQMGASVSGIANRIAALPNGRHQGDILYDGGCSPGAGFDKKGPTAVLRSISKLDHMHIKQENFNQRLMPDQMQGEKGFQLWLNYMKTWYDLGVPHVQFNCVDSDTLKAAQREPEKYTELIVRIGGYSAIFAHLNKMCQDSIIVRTIQEL